MKQLFILISALFISNGLWAQEQTNFEKHMSRALTNLGKAKTAEEYQNISNTFQRIAENEPDRWEPAYYQAFAKTLQAFTTKDKVNVSAELESITDQLKQTLEMPVVSKDNSIQSEIHVLIAMMYSARISANPMVLGPQLGATNAEHLGKAEGFNSSNPRVYLLQAQNLFYTPEAFGGDKVKAKLLAEKAFKIFNTIEADGKEDNVNSLMPNWGKGQVVSLIKSIEGQQ